MPVCGCAAVFSRDPGEGSKTKRDRSKGTLPESGQPTLIDKYELGKRESVIVAVGVGVDNCERGAKLRRFGTLGECVAK
jgi:hypothetical protein